MAAATGAFDAVGMRSNPGIFRLHASSVRPDHTSGRPRAGSRNVWPLAVCLGLLVGGVLAGWGQNPRPVRQQPSASIAAAVRALSSPTSRTGQEAEVRAAERAVPAGFARTLGYRPRVDSAHGRVALVNPNGACSSPFGPTVFGFGLACRHHDLGYDMLRLADDRGQPLGHWARAQVDARFAADLRQRCEQVGPTLSMRGAGCRLTAAAYVAVVQLNSWRQGWGPPVVEHLAPWLAGAVLGSAATLTVGLAPHALTANAANKRGAPTAIVVSAH